MTVKKYYLILLAGLFMLLLSACGGETSATDDEIAPAPTLNAAFKQSCSGQVCQFDATDSSTSSTSYSWDFGDGSQGVGMLPAHNYARSGLYSVSLSVSDNADNQATLELESEVYSSSAVETIQTIWDYHKAGKETYLRNQFDAGSNQGLYVTQIDTRNVLRYAVESNNLTLLDDLTALYLVPLDYIKEETEQQVYYLPNVGDPETYTYVSTVPLSAPAQMWKEAEGDEATLQVSQFLMAISQTLNFILALDDTERSVNMQQFVQQYPAILLSHYNRWVFNDPSFQLRGWGCLNGLRTHRERVENLLAKSNMVINNFPQCNAIFDSDMFIIAGVGELLAANIKDPVRVPLSSVDINRFQSYVALGAQMLESHISYVPLTNFEGQPVIGAILDRDIWDEYQNYEFSGYSSFTYPDLTADKQAAVHTSQDFSHATRFVTIFESLRRNRTVTKQTFPNDQIMAEFANQIAYNVFNKNFTKPSFSTYMGGVDGWYRVGYSGRLGFGYAPGQMSNVMLTGGYAFWREFNDDLRMILDISWDYAINNTDEDNAFKYSCWYDYAPACLNDYISTGTSLTLLEGLTSYPMIDMN